MPLLLYLPFIIWSGLFDAFADTTRVPVRVKHDAEKRK